MLSGPRCMASGDRASGGTPGLRSTTAPSTLIHESSLHDLSGGASLAVWDRDVSALTPTEELALLGIRAAVDTDTEQRLQSLLANDSVLESLGVTALKWGVAPLLYCGLRRFDLDPLTLARFRDLGREYLHSAGQNSLLFSALKEVLRALQSASVPVIVLKGAALAETVYPNRSARPMGDIDLMVRESDLQRAHSALLSVGYTSLTQLTVEAQARISHHLYPLVNANRMAVELHWTLVRPDRPFRPDLDGLWERAQPTEIASVPVWVLSPEDLLLHLSLQVSQDRFAGTLRSLCDIDHAAHCYRNEINWRTVRQRAVTWSAQHSAYLSLRLASELLGTAVPDEILDELQPGDFDRRLLAWATDRLLVRLDGPWGLGPRFMRVLRTESYRQKMRSLLRMAFPSREVVAEPYGISPDSRTVYLYYVIRLRDEFSRSSQTVRRLLTRESGATEAASQDKLLAEWLESA